MKKLITLLLIAASLTGWAQSYQTVVGAKAADGKVNLRMGTNAVALSDSLKLKEPLIMAGTTSQYYRGDKSFQTLNTSVVPELTNLYYTDIRSRAAHSFVAGSGAYNSSTGVITIPTNNNQLTNGAGYITSSALSPYALLSGANFTGSVNNTSDFVTTSTFTTKKDGTNTGNGLFGIQTSTGINQGAWGIIGDGTSGNTLNDIALFTYNNVGSLSGVPIRVNRLTLATVFGGVVNSSNGFVGGLTGNASTATILANTRTIWGQNFNGSANISGALTGVTGITNSGAYTQTSTSDNTFTGKSQFTNIGIGTTPLVRRLQVSSDGTNWGSAIFGGANGAGLVQIGNIGKPTIAGVSSDLTAFTNLLIQPSGNTEFGGGITIDNLAGTGTRMTVSLPDGTQSTQPIPTGGGGGSVTGVAVATANGLAGTSDGASVVPTLTLSTTVTGLLKGNGTAISAATAGTDYLVPASPNLTGTPTAPTAASGTNTTQLATTAFVQSAVANLSVGYNLFTPTITNGVNGSSGSSPTLGSFYTRIGNFITVYGTITLTPVSTGSNVQFFLSLPIASNMTNMYDLTGFGTANVGGYDGLTISADTVNDRAELNFFNNGSSTAAATVRFSYTYNVL